MGSPYHRMALVLIRGWSRLVPGGRRGPWIAEWTAELAEAAVRGAKWVLLRRALLAGRDAVAVARLSRPRRRGPSSDTSHGGTSMLTALVEDLRFSFRTLRRRPGFAALAIATVAIGVGANTAIFSVVDGILWRSLPYPAEERLVAIWPAQWFSKREVVRLQEEATSFAAIAAHTTGGLTPITSGGIRELVPGLQVSADYFRVLGVPPLLGRGFEPGEDRSGRTDVVVVSQGFFRDRLDGETSRLGETRIVDDAARRVVGVMPADFEFFGGDAAVVRPLALSSDQPDFDGRFLQLIGRLKPGVEVAQATEELRVLAARWTATYDYNTNWANGADVVQLRDSVASGIRPTLLILLGAVGLTLVIAAANFANLLLARALARQSEMGVRIALGARPSRLLRQALTESTLLAVLGGAVGVALAIVGVRGLVALLPAATPRLTSVGIDGPALMYSAAVTLFTGWAAGLLPALHLSRGHAVGAMQAGSRSTTAGRSRHRLRAVLVAGQVAVAVILLVAAGLVVKSFWLVTRVDPGLEVDQVLTLTVLPSPVINRDAASLEQYFDVLRERLAALPGVSAVDAIHVLPIGGGGWIMGVSVEGVPPTGEWDGGVYWRPVTPHYFRTAGMRLLAGRGFTEDDVLGSEPAVILSQAAAEKYWPGVDPIGKRLRIGFVGQEWLTVVGVVADVHIVGLAQAPPAAVFAPYRQAVPALAQRNILQRVLTLRTTVPPADMVTPVRDLMRRVAPDVGIVRLEPMSGVVYRSLAERRAIVIVLGAFSVTALLLGAVGIYGMMSYWVGERRREIGIRIALGAGGGRVVGLVLGQGVRMAALGAGVGAAGAILGHRVLSNAVYQVSTTDPVVLGLGPVVLVLIAAAATMAPARRAARTDPLETMKGE